MAAVGHLLICSQVGGRRYREKTPNGTQVHGVVPSALGLTSSPNLLSHQLPQVLAHTYKLWCMCISIVLHTYMRDTSLSVRIHVHCLRMEYFLCCGHTYNGFDHWLCGYLYIYDLNLIRKCGSFAIIWWHSNLIKANE